MGHDLFSFILCSLFRIWHFVGSHIPMSTMGERPTKITRDTTRRWEGHGEAFDMLDLALGKFYSCS